METKIHEEKARLIDTKNQYWMLQKETSKHLIRYLSKQILFSIKYQKLPIFKTLLICGALISYFFIPPKVIERWKVAPAPDPIYVSDETKTMDKFLELLGKVESNGNYKIVNQFGYMGKYQLGRTALKQIGLEGISSEEYLNNPELQEVAIKLLLKENKRILATQIGKYQSRTIGGIYITESSILAAAHLCPKGVMDFLKSGGEEVFKDGNGCPITKYLKMFSGYKITL